MINEQRPSERTGDPGPVPPQPYGHSSLVGRPLSNQPGKQDTLNEVQTGWTPGTETVIGEEVQRQIAILEQELASVIVGQRQVVRGVLTALLAGGHVLLEGVPGLGKTLLVRTLAECVDLTYSRIQFTPDLMPSDITGTDVITETEEGRRFTFQPTTTSHPSRNPLPRSWQETRRPIRSRKSASRIARCCSSFRSWSGGATSYST